MNTDTPALALRDIHLPEPISWWPPAPGWWLLLCAALLVGFILWFGYRRWQHRQRQRDSLRALHEIRASFAQNQNNAKLLRELSVLMRRSCITFYPRKLSAGLTGEHWLQFLDATAASTEFSNGVGKALANAPYLPERAQAGIDSHALLMLCENWLRAQPNKHYLARKASTTHSVTQS